MDPALQELRDQFFRALDEGGPEQDVANKVWVLFIEHPWFQAELKRAACRVLWHVGAHLQWAADIEQEVVVMLREKLSRKSNLGVNRAKAENQFSGWLATIIERTCRDAVRAMLARQTRIVADVRLIAAAQAKPRTSPIRLIWPRRLDRCRDGARSSSFCRLKDSVSGKSPEY